MNMTSAVKSDLVQVHRSESIVVISLHYMFYSIPKDKALDLPRK